MNASLSKKFATENNPTKSEIETLQRAIFDNLFHIQGKSPAIATKNDFYMAVAYTVRDHLLQNWLNTIQTNFKENVKIVCYLSAEFLVGPHLSNNLINLDIENSIYKAVKESGLDIQELIDTEKEPGLGSGGLGRLAACYMDSLSSLEIPAIGYGIRYEFGIFNQKIRDGWQVEITDKWLQQGNPWEVARPEASVTVNFGGHTEPYTDEYGVYRVRWVPEYVVKGIPYDTPVLGYKVNIINTLRLWKSEACESFDFQRFDLGDYYEAVNSKVNLENISAVLYPNDEPIQGKKLRLQQQYFFVSCSLQDMIRTHLGKNPNLDNFHEQWAAQMNDTHPAVGVAELMRLLVDIHHYEWDQAWKIVQNTFSYTNHSLLPEALEKWPLSVFIQLLPRIVEIIYEINQRFLERVHIKFLGNTEKLSNLSLIDESGAKYVRMANLACVGSHTINSVSSLHSKLLKETVLRDFYELFPEKFINVTNGVTPRRWIVQSNPRLTQLIKEKIGDDWIKRLDKLQKLEDFIDDSSFRHQWRIVKRAVKQDLADYIQINGGIQVDPTSLFDVQVKRIHESKRQHLNILHIITLYNRLKHDPNLDIVPRTFIFSGKAAPGYFMAKRIIKLITSVGDVVNNDPEIGNNLKVIFLPNYNVSLGQRVYPAADLSEQIATAGKEVSGTSNMKFSLNGALTIGTFDGTNAEIQEAVAKENFFLFGLTSSEVSKVKSQQYVPRHYYEKNEELRGVIDLISSGFFSYGDCDLFKPIIDNLLYDDPYLLLADYQSYIDCQEKVDEAYKNQDYWSRMSILNVARMGKFSSDRSIQEYCDHIWNAKPITIELQS
ncbi:glycogen/starch/alpha-glucan phosphorylase [Cyanobacterium sp. uoEpiScrs1]|uniref:glycogen/starch/alpha-glucan phosphorylase n=1 Tax=Cyanobacterium sp. uoEpiScrs1 TaxID=2976343 RepID=UPI00226A388A|nr:glycogen/starch/alpha-glucan phosphorylase [Cyanobacterium sp. uoEpiScrs1]